MHYSDPDDRIFRDDLRVNMNKSHCESLIKRTSTTSTGQPACLECNRTDPLIESNLKKVTLHCPFGLSKNILKWHQLNSVQKYRSYGEIRHHRSGLAIVSLRQKKHVGSKRPGLTSCRSNIHAAWSLAREIPNIQKLHLGNEHLTMAAAILWNLCASIPARPWPSSLWPSSLRVAWKPPIRSPAQPLTLPLLLAFLPGEVKTSRAGPSCPAMVCSACHFRKWILISCLLSWLSNCFLIICITESTSIFHHLVANLCQLPCSRRLRYFSWQKCLMAALLVVRTHSPQNCVNKSAEISDVSITNKSLLHISATRVT